MTNPTTSWTKWISRDEGCLVEDIRFENKNGRRFQMFMVPYGNGSIAYISNYTYWKKVHEEGTILDRLIGGISHETVHHVLKKHFSKRSCKRLDRLTRPVGGLITHSGLPDHCCLDEIERYFQSKGCTMNKLTKN